MAQDILLDGELGWDDVIENDSPDFVLLPEGEYDFAVVSFERGRHGGSEKLPPCSKAVLGIRVTAPDGQSTQVTHNVFLHKRTEGMMCAFFTAIGQRKKGEAIKPNWNAVIGATGRCKVSVREWTNDKGETRKSNDIKRFLEPEEKTATYQAGRF